MALHHNKCALLHKQANTDDVMDHNAVLEATKHHDPYAQAMEELNCATEGLTASIHQVMDLERQRQRKKTHLNRIKASKRRFPIPNYPITQLPNYPLYPFRQLKQLRNVLNICHVR
jgi:hypothetical protein